MKINSLLIVTNEPQYNPFIHHRRSIRLKGYDYSRAGLYFITICLHNRQCLFGEILNDIIQLNEFGWVAHHQWEKISERFPNVEPDVFQIMPNHMHGIIALNETVGSTLAVDPDGDNNGMPMNDRTRVNGVPTVGDIVGAYKSLVSNECLEIFKSKHTNKIMGKLWQRNYYEHIIRDEQSFQNIRQYIIDNPVQWSTDKLNPHS